MLVAYQCQYFCLGEDALDNLGGRKSVERLRLQTVLVDNRLQPGVLRHQVGIHHVECRIEFEHSPGVLVRESFYVLHCILTELLAIYHDDVALFNQVALKFCQLFLKVIVELFFARYPLGNLVVVDFINLIVECILVVLHNVALKHIKYHLQTLML